MSDETRTDREQRLNDVMVAYVQATDAGRVCVQSIQAELTRSIQACEIRQILIQLGEEIIDDRIALGQAGVEVVLQLKIHVRTV